MDFNLESSLQILERTPGALSVLLSDIDERWTLNNEDGDTWSVFDVVGHLIHGEKTDWLPRAKMILDGSGETFETFDRFAQFDESKGKTLTELLNEFTELRTRNLETLRTLNITADMLTMKGVHPEFGEVTLSQLLATWVVHDLNHVSHISRIMAKQYAEAVGPWSEYLGILK